MLTPIQYKIIYYRINEVKYYNDFDRLWNYIIISLGVYNSFTCPNILEASCCTKKNHLCHHFFDVNVDVYFSTFYTASFFEENLKKQQYVILIKHWFDTVLENMELKKLLGYHIIPWNIHLISFNQKIIKNLS